MGSKLCFKNIDTLNGHTYVTLTGINWKHPDKLSWGDRLQVLLYQVRVAQGMSAKKLADRSGISRTHILRIENGWSSPTLRCLCRLADALDVEVGELYQHHKGDPIF